MLQLHKLVAGFPTHLDSLPSSLSLSLYAFPLYPSLTCNTCTSNTLRPQQIPHTIELYLLDVSVQDARQKLREQFYKNAHIRDPRIIDMLVIKVLNYATSPRLTCYAPACIHLYIYVLHVHVLHTSYIHDSPCVLPNLLQWNLRARDNFGKT